MHKVLLVEDDPALAKLISEYLSEHEFSVTTIVRGDVVLKQLRGVAPDVIVLDLMLPGMSGMEVCRSVRQQSETPILILTARDDSHDQVLGLESGADDYVVKPVEPRVLLARLRTLLRRSVMDESKGGDADLVFGRLAISRQDRKVTWRREPVELTSSEFNLLLVLAGAAGTVLSRDAIMNQLRGIEFDGMNRSVDDAISKLRRKFEDGRGEPRRIKTVWGRGYLFSPSEWED
jgi:two-component system OmpR family response regulator